MSVIATATDLAAVLKMVVGGATIALAPGTYPHVRYAPATPLSGPVTITAADPANPPYFAQGIELVGAADLTLSGLKVGREDATVNYNPLVKISGGHDITLDAMHLSGLDKGTGYFGYGVQASGIDGLTIKSSKLDHLYRAATIGSTKRLLIADNDHEFLQGDAYQMVSITGARLLRNLFERFYTFGAGHVDAFQFMIRANSADIASSDVAAQDNFVGNDPANGHVQFFFARSLDATKQFLRLTVERNETFGTNWYAVQFIGADDVALNDNTAWFVPAANSTITDAMFRTESATGTANRNRSTKSGLDLAVMGVGNEFDRAKYTATLEQMAAAKAAWCAKFRSPPAPPVRPASAILGDLVATAAANAKLIDELRASIGGAA